MQRDENVINASFARLLEIIRFSKMQMEKLGNYETFNLHVVQVLPEMAQLIEKMCQAGANSAELISIVERYSFYVNGVNQQEYLNQLEELKKYPAFSEALEKKGAVKKE